MSCQSITDNTLHLKSNQRYTEGLNHFKNKNIITFYEVEEILKNAVSSSVELIDYNFHIYSEEKLGFLGKYLCLVLEYKKPYNGQYIKQRFFVKTIPYDIPSQVAYIEDKGAFRKEIEFFKYLMPFLMENFKGDDWAPQCYLTNKNTIVLEDMKLQGFSNRSKIFNEITIKSAIACIARMHSCSLIAEEKLNGRSLNKVYPNACQESEYKPSNRNYKWFVTAIHLAISIAEDLGLDTSAILESSHRVFEIGKPSENKCNVISHGDLWSNNILFNSANCCKLVDFQLIRYAPLAHDVMQLLYLTTTREFREKYEMKMVKYYYKELIESLSINNFQGIVPTFTEVLQGVEEQRFPALVSTTINFPTIMINNKIGAEIMNSQNAYEAYFFQDRRPFVNKIMSLDSEYEWRVKEIIRELAEWSLKIDRLPHAT